RPLMGGIKKKKKGMPIGQQLTLVDNPSFNIEGLVPYERRNGLVQYQKPEFLDGARPAKKDANRRQELAKFVVKYEYFGKAFANRLWGHVMGRRFTKQPDDFGEHNPVSMPELLDRMAKEWISSTNKHDPRVLIRWICNSKAYHLASVANPSNDKVD